MVQGSSTGPITRALSPFKAPAAASKTLGSGSSSVTATAEKKGTKRRKAGGEELAEDKAETLRRLHCLPSGSLTGPEAEEGSSG